MQGPRNDKTPPGEREDLADLMARLEPIDEEFPEIEDLPPEPFELDL